TQSAKQFMQCRWKKRMTDEIAAFGRERKIDKHGCAFAHTGERQGSRTIRVSEQYVIAAPSKNLILQVPPKSQCAEIARISFSEQFARTGDERIASFGSDCPLQLKWRRETREQKLRRGWSVEKSHESRAILHAAFNDFERFTAGRGGRDEHKHVGRFKH